MRGKEMVESVIVKLKLVCQWMVQMAILLSSVHIGATDGIPSVVRVLRRNLRAAKEGGRFEGVFRSCYYLRGVLEMHWKRFFGWGC